MRVQFALLAACAAVLCAMPAAAQPASERGAAVPPQLTVKLSPKRFPVGDGTTFTWQASEPVEVGIRIEQRVPPKRRGGKATFKRVAVLIRNAPAGEGTLKFSGRIPGKGALKPGAYRAIVRASDQFDNKSEPTTLPFRVLAR
jgi:hypothetical protein